METARGKQIIVLTPDEALYQRVISGLTGAPAYRLRPRTDNPDDAVRLGGQGALDLILLDLRLQPADPLAPVRDLHARLPQVPIAVLAGAQDADGIRRALLAGARSFLPLEFQPASLVQLADDLTALRLVESGAASQAQGQVVLVFSLKGGVGRTLLASNLAVSLRQGCGRPVVLVDGQAVYGDTEVDLNLTPQHSIADLVNQVDHLEPNLVEEALTKHASGVRILAAADSPGEAERVQAQHLTPILNMLRQHNAWVVVDTGSVADDRLDAMLEASNLVLLVTTPEMTSLRAARAFLRAAREQDYPRERLRLVVNRADLVGGVPLKEIERSLGLPTYARLADDSGLVTFSVNRGVPLVTSHPRKPLARGVEALARNLISELAPGPDTRGRGRRG